MVSLNHLVYDILSSLGGQSRIPQDIDIDPSLIQFKIINSRAFLIRQDQKLGRSLSDNISQSLFCVPVTQVDVSECPCTVPSDCKIMRTTVKLPKFIELHQKDFITKVSGVDIRSQSWSIISFARASVAGLNSWTSKNTKVFLHNQYLYIINPPLNLTKITVQGVFEDPRDAASFANCSGTPCYTDDMEFPVSAHMLLTIKELVLKDLGLLVQMPLDNKANEEYNKSTARPSRRD